MVNHMKKTLDIADDLLRRAREVAEKENVALKLLVEEGLRLVLERREQGKPADIQPFVVTGDEPAPDDSWERLRDLVSREDASGIRE